MKRGDLLKHRITGKVVLLLKIEYRLYSDDGTMVSSNPVGLVLESGEAHYEELKYFQPV
jgi:hypothetical protein